MISALIVNRRNSSKRQKEVNYRGFDGAYFFGEDYWEDFELWLMDKDKCFELNDNYLADLRYLDDLIEYVDSKNSLDIDLLLISDPSYINSHDKFTFIGYYYGEISGYNYAEDDKDELYFSIVINEVHNRPFKGFITKLNEYYLFSDIKDVMELDKVRDENTLVEPAIEPEDCEIFKIHLYKKITS